MTTEFQKRLKEKRQADLADEDLHHDEEAALQRLFSNYQKCKTLEEVEEIYLTRPYTIYDMAARAVKSGDLPLVTLLLELQREVYHTEEYGDVGVQLLLDATLKVAYEAEEKDIYEFLVSKGAIPEPGTEYPSQYANRTLKTPIKEWD